jgi:hypothetical protein
MRRSKATAIRHAAEDRLVARKINGLILQEALAKRAESPCPQCGCVPGDAWGCEDCTNPDCPCSEREDEEEDA